MEDVWRTRRCYANKLAATSCRFILCFIFICFIFFGLGLHAGVQEGKGRRLVREFTCEDTAGLRLVRMSMFPVPGRQCMCKHDLDEAVAAALQPARGPYPGPGAGFPLAARHRNAERRAAREDMQRWRGVAE